MDKEKIIFERKRAICKEVFDIIKQHPEFDIAVTLTFEKPPKWEKTWLVTQEKIIAEAVSAKGYSEIDIRDLPNLDWKDYIG